MAVVQISRIQHRRGLQQDLPQLASAELGWSVDTQRLYIGNGTTNEGAPIEGVTEILTENSISRNELISYYGTYTFVGNVAGLVAQTGSSTLNPTYRSIQQKLDDFVNVKDFGATGNGVTDDTASINRALQQIYIASKNETDPRTRRTIYFPGGNYKISDTILIPAYAKLVGDGPSSSIINLSVANKSVANIVDSKFQSGSSIGTNSAILPNEINVIGLNFLTSNATPQLPLVNIDSASNIKFQNTSFTGNVNPGYYANLVTILNSVAVSQKINFVECNFQGGGNGLVIQSPTVSTVKVINSNFDNISNAAVNLGGSLHFASINNYYGSVGSTIAKDGNNFNLSLGDNISTSSNVNGLILGNAQISLSSSIVLSTLPTLISLLPNAAAKTNYEIANTSAKRYGSITCVTNGSATEFNDQYIETATSVNANLFANVDTLIASVSSGTALLQLNFERFV